MGQGTKTEGTSSRLRGEWELADSGDCEETVGAKDGGSRHMQTYEVMDSGWPARQAED